MYFTFLINIHPSMYFKYKLSTTKLEVDKGLKGLNSSLHLFELKILFNYYAINIYIIIIYIQIIHMKC